MLGVAHAFKRSEVMGRTHGGGRVSEKVGGFSQTCSEPGRESSGPGISGRTFSSTFKCYHQRFKCEFQSKEIKQLAGKSISLQDSQVLSEETFSFHLYMTRN